VQPRYLPGLPDPAGSVREALRAPIAAPPLRECARATDTVGIIFSDITRPTPNALLLPRIRAELDHVPDARIILFNATGTHRANTDAELRTMLGDEVVERYHIVQHDAMDDDSHAYLGTTASGNAIHIERAFLQCDVRILTGFIEPHFFAGFSGGGKAVMPGLAALETVQRNHNARNMDDPRARWGVTHGNPVWEEVREAAAMAAPTFLLNVTLNRDKQVTGVFAGDWRQAHTQGCAFVRKTAMVPVDAPFDIVISTNSGYPLDLNLYQSVKGMSAAAQVVKPGGSIIMAADCWDGIPSGSAYGQLLAGASNFESLLNGIRAPGFTHPEMWQAQIHALIGQQADLYFFSHNLTAAQLRGALLTPCASIEETVAELLLRYGAEARICVLPEGPQTVPYLAGYLRDAELMR
jgi:nickel-dependent lactate racemase